MMPVAQMIRPASPVGVVSSGLCKDSGSAIVMHETAQRTTSIVEMGECWCAANIAPKVTRGQRNAVECSTTFSPVNPSENSIQLSASIFLALINVDQESGTSSSSEGIQSRRSANDVSVGP